MPATTQTRNDILSANSLSLESSEPLDLGLSPSVLQSSRRRTMNAVFIEQTGGADVLQYGALPFPSPAPGQVLLKVGAVAVNSIDVEIRSGRLPMPLRYPYIVGSDVAGTVVTCGLGVRRFSEGDRVWGSNQGLFGRQGTFAEYVVVDEKWLYPIPMGQSHAEAAAGAMIGLTASLALFHSARLRRGEVVFVNGGTAGASSAVLQQAKAAGACVIVAQCSPGESTHCQEQQADLVLDSHSETFDRDLCEFIAPRGGIDVWLEMTPVSSLIHPVAMMAEGGRIVLMEGQTSQLDLPVRELQANHLSVLGSSLFTALPDLQRRYATDLNARCSYGAWRPHIGPSFTLSQTAEAQQLQERLSRRECPEVIGKIVVIPDQ